MAKVGTFEIWTNSALAIGKRQGKAAYAWIENHSVSDGSRWRRSCSSCSRHASRAFRSNRCAPTCQPIIRGSEGLICRARRSGRRWRPSRALDRRAPRTDYCLGRGTSLDSRWFPAEPEWLGLRWAAHFLKG